MARYHVTSAGDRNASWGRVVYIDDHPCDDQACAAVHRHVHTDVELFRLVAHARAEGREDQAAEDLVADRSAGLT